MTNPTVNCPPTFASLQIRVSPLILVFTKIQPLLIPPYAPRKGENSCTLVSEGLREM